MGTPHRVAPHAYAIRPAVDIDVDTLVAFTRNETREAEGVEIDIAAATRGVRGGFQHPPLATYWVAETATGEVVASTSVVREWSNMHGGHYWWVQSLYIVPEHRGQGLVEHLLDHLAGQAAAAGALDLRLYARGTNARALSAYERCGFTAAPYVILRRPLG